VSIEVQRETPSTNAELVDRLRTGAYVREGHWLIADRQTRGRGRQGRSWEDGAGNFMGSTVVQLGPGDPRPATLALVAGMAVWEALAPRLPDAHAPRLKWPNDVMIGPAKVAGILLEREGQTVVVGIGANLARAPDVQDRATVSLAEFGPAPGRDAFADDLARRFALELERWRSFGVPPIVARWLAAAHPVGTPLTVRAPGDEPVSGTFAGLTAEGALQLRLADGTTRAVHAGDVSLAAA
jgi:BirA family transcriptional regulator, biotin operon repressor / biotin---[acetyl-CoA-carboxylase] ligase